LDNSSRYNSRILSFCRSIFPPTEPSFFLQNAHRIKLAPIQQPSLLLHNYIHYVCLIGIICTFLTIYVLNFFPQVPQGIALVESMSTSLFPVKINQFEDKAT
jgi:hypothetical protein